MELVEAGSDGIYMLESCFFFGLRTFFSVAMVNILLIPIPVKNSEQYSTQVIYRPCESDVTILLN